MTKKIIIHTSGFIVIALGIALIISSRLGASPIDAFNYFLYEIINPIFAYATLGRIIIFTGLFVTALAFILNKKPDMLISAVFLFVVGLFVDFWLLIIGFIPDQYTVLLVIRIFMATFGMLFCAFGVAVTILTNLPASPYERLMLVIHKRINNLSLSKMIVEGSFFVLAVILGLLTQKLFEQVHIFTIIMTFMMGILVSIFTHILKNKFLKGEINYGN